MQKIKSDNIKSKILFKLNDNLFKQNLPIIAESKFKDKENNLFSTTTNESFRLMKKKSGNFFNLPKRFKKHNNKIEDNMAVLNKSAYEQHGCNVAVSKTCSSSFYKPGKPQAKGQVMHLLNKKRSKVSIQEEPKRTPLKPKTLQGIERYFQQKYHDQWQKTDNIHKNSSGLRLKSQKVSKQISQIFYQNKHMSMLSRFTLLQLKSYYCSILNFSRGDTHKFKYAFQIMLNLANVTVRQNILSQCLKELIHQGMTFAKFLKTFTNIQQKLRKETIIDYFEILLQEVVKPFITYEELIKTFEGRMKREIASELTVLLYEKLGKDYSECVSKKEIHALCYDNEQFCNRFYLLNNENMLSNKFSQEQN